MLILIDYLLDPQKLNELVSFLQRIQQAGKPLIGTLKPIQNPIELIKRRKRRRRGRPRKVGRPRKKYSN